MDETPSVPPAPLPFSGGKPPAEMSVRALRQAARELGVPVFGTKLSLLQRLEDHLANPPAPSRITTAEDLECAPLAGCAVSLLAEACSAGADATQGVAATWPSRRWPQSAPLGQRALAFFACSPPCRSMAMPTSTASISRTELLVMHMKFNSTTSSLTVLAGGRLWGELSERYKDELQGDTSPAEAASLAVRRRRPWCM